MALKGVLSLREGVPALVVEARRALECLDVLLGAQAEHTGRNVSGKLAWEDILAGDMLPKVLHLLQVYLEVFLAADPVFMVLGHLKRILNRRKGLNWKLVNEMPLLKVLTQVEAENGRWLP